jgi:hypothetical protein
MDLSRLASKQKRHQNLALFAASEAIAPEVKQALEKALVVYQDVLAECWRKQTVTPEDVSRINSLDRELDSLSNAARLRTAAP